MLGDVEVIGAGVAVDERGVEALGLPQEPGGLGHGGLDPGAPAARLGGAVGEQAAQGRLFSGAVELAQGVAQAKGVGGAHLPGDRALQHAALAPGHVGEQEPTADGVVVQDGGDDAAPQEAAHGGERGVLVTGLSAAALVILEPGDAAVGEEEPHHPRRAPRLGARVQDPRSAPVLVTDHDITPSKLAQAGHW